MTRLKILTATAVLATIIASPVMAQQMAPDTPAAHRYHGAYDYRDNGFWPGDVAAGVVGGAIGTADAIATTPFRGSDSYAYYDGGYYNGGYDNGYYGGYANQQYGGYGNLDPSYAVRNGFVCQPGTWIRGEDGRRHICQ